MVKVVTYPCPKSLDRNQSGFTYLVILIAIAVLGISLAAVSELWAASVRRSKLAEIDWIGAQFTRAIGSYYQGAPNNAMVYPLKLSDLLDDRRYLTTRRYLRDVYANPFSGKPDWQLVLAADGRIQGVRAFLSGDNVGEWKDFVYIPSIKQ